MPGALRPHSHVPRHPATRCCVIRFFTPLHKGINHPRLHTYKHTPALEFGKIKLLTRVAPNAETRTIEMRGALRAHSHVPRHPATRCYVIRFFTPLSHTKWACLPTCFGGSFWAGPGRAGVPQPGGARQPAVRLCPNCTSTRAAATRVRARHRGHPIAPLKRTPRHAIGQRFQSKTAAGCPWGGIFR